MAGFVFPAELIDWFGNRITFNLRVDGRLLAVHQNPFGWTEQLDVAQSLIEPWLTETLINDAAIWAVNLRAEYGRTDIYLGGPFSPQPYDPAQLWSMGMGLRGPNYRQDYSTPLARLQWALLFHSPGYIKFVESRGGIVRGGPADLYYYTDDWNKIVPAYEAKLRSNAKSEASRRGAIITFGAFVVGQFVGALIGAATASASGYGDVTAQPPEPTGAADMPSEYDALEQLGALAAEDAANAAQVSLNSASLLSELPAANVISQITGSIGGLLNGAGGILGSVVDFITGGILKSGDSGSNALVGILQTLAAGLHDVVGAVQSTLLPILRPIEDAISITAGAVRDLNDNLIKPVFGTILELQRTYDALAKSIDRNLGDGIEGLVRLGNDLSAGFTSMESSVARGVAQLSKAQEDQIRGALADVLSGTVGTPLAGIERGLSTSYAGTVGSDEMAANIHLSRDVDAEKIADGIRKLTADMRAADGLWAPFIHLIATFLDFGPMVLGYGKAATDSAYNAGRSAFMGERIPAGSAIEAWRRKIIDSASLKGELNTSGFDDARQRVLMELAERLVPVTEALELWRRGLIDEPSRNDLLLRAGVPAEQIGRVVQVTERLKGLATIVAEYSLMTAAAGTGVLGSEELNAPEAVLAQGYELGESTASIHAAWRLQWSLPSVASATQLYFRGLITLDQLWAFYDVADLPRGLHWPVLEGQRQLIPARTAISMRKAGILDDGRMHEIIAAAGYSPADAELLIQFANIEDGAPPKAAADALHGLTQSTVLNLYEAGTIEQSVAVGLLVQIGIGSDAAELAILLVDLQIQQDERKATTDLIVAQVEAGDLSVDDAQGALAVAGLTTEEMQKAYTRILKALKGKSKLPSVSDLGRMWKRSVIDDTIYTQTVQRHGYSSYWAGLMLAALKGGEIPEGG